MKIFAPPLYKPTFKGFTPYKTHNVNDAVRDNDVQIKYDVFAYEKPSSIKTDFGTIRYLKNQKLSELEFNEPLNLSQALRQIQKAQYYHNICSYGLPKQDRNFDLLNMAFSQKFKNMKFTKFLGAGNTALALENEDGKLYLLDPECAKSDSKIREFEQNDRDFTNECIKNGWI